MSLTNGNEYAKTKRDAESLAVYNLQNFELFWGLVIWHNFLFVVNIMSKVLQSKDMQIEVAIRELENLLVYIKGYMETRFEEAMLEASKIADDMDVQHVFIEKRRVQRKKQFDDSASQAVSKSGKESFKTDYFLFIVDKSISSFNVRFEQFKNFEKQFVLLIDLNKLKAANSDGLKSFCNNLTKSMEHNQISDHDKNDIFKELEMLSRNVPNDVKRAIDVLNYIEEVDCAYPNAWIAYRIMLTLPVTVVHAERSFSKLKLIKSYLRSSMSQERPSGLATLSIEKYMIEKLDYSVLISTFASKNARRVIFK